MKQVIVEIDDWTAKELERIAPARSRKRSAFIRAAIRKAIDAVLDEETAEAYRRQPQTEDEFYFEPEGWLPWEPDAPERKPRRRKSPRPRAARPRDEGNATYMRQQEAYEAAERRSGATAAHERPMPPYGTRRGRHP